ncbi:MAG TPA: hypothetical protein VGF18_03075 [Candidatus Tumulicola sp.]
MTRRAFAAVVEARVFSQRHTLVYGLVAAGLVGAVQPRGLAAPAFFCSLVGIIAALQQGPRISEHLDMCELCAPLFGRELARAKATVPCAIALVATVAYCATASLAGWRGIPATFAGTVAAAIPATLTALCATLRTGSARRLYLGMAAGASAIVVAIVTWTQVPWAAGIFAALAAFLALRQYGEALARYDPV